MSFFLVYGLFHVYAFFKAKTALSLHPNTYITLAALMLIMVFAPFIVNYSEKGGFEFFARVMAYTGYLWMGALFLFVCSGLLLDIYRLMIYLATLAVQKDFSSVIPSARFSFFIPLLISIAISSYGYFEAWDIRTEHVTVKTSKLPDNISGLKIAQISDVHLGLIVREEKLKKILDQVKFAEPDLLVSTGDLVDGRMNKHEELADILKGIHPRYGKFAITGNHEFYAGIDQAMSFTKKAGFKMLRGEALNVDGIINIAGVDDPAGNINGLSKNVAETQLLSGLDHDKFTLLLKHRPLVDKDASGLFDLQLSGHAHKGQIFPFSLITKIYFPADYGMLNLVDSSYLYVNRGAGTWGPPIRFLSPPEVTVIELVNR